VLSRRRFLIAGTLLSAGAVYAYQRGLRYPRLSLEPGALAERLTLPSATFELHDVIELRGHDTLAFRAIAPEPTLAINTQRGKIEFLVNNIAQNAQLEVSGKGIKLLGEKIEGITRKLTLESGVEQTLRLDWRLPNNGGLDFAVMGDTGGGAELSWTIERATELDAQFLLHLGDFNYQEGEYTNAIKQFLNAPIPCYISIGNHDFHDNGLI